MESTQSSQQHTIDSRISEILEKIKHNEISIHSKTFFRLKWLAFALLVASICVVSVLLCSFILFTIQMTGQPYLIDFGSQGVKLLFIIFPWMLFLLDGLLILLLGHLTRHTSFGYKIPGVYIFLGSIFIIGVSGYIVESYTTLHARMLQRADVYNMPIVTSLYKNTRRAPPPGYEIYRGVVVGKGEGYIHVNIENQNQMDPTSQVTVVFSTSSPHTFDMVETGQTVFVSGKIINGQIINARLKPIPRLLEVR